MTEHKPIPLPPPRVSVDGKDYMRDARGKLCPVEMIRPVDQLIDGQVRKIMGFALALSRDVAGFKAHTFEDIGAVEALLEQEYGAKLGGAKGNKVLTSFDGLLRVEVRVQDRLDFGPELQVAKSLVDECLIEWSADSRAEIRDIVTRAFNTDKAGQINRAEVFMLLRLEIADPRWQQAMRAIRDAIRVVGSAVYVRCQVRDAFDAPWRTVTIDLAKA